MAEGLAEGGTIHAVEINDELDYSTKYEKLRALAQKEAEA